MLAIYCAVMQGALFAIATESTSSTSSHYDEGGCGMEMRFYAALWPYSI